MGLHGAWFLCTLDLPDVLPHTPAAAALWCPQPARIITRLISQGSCFELHESLFSFEASLCAYSGSLLELCSGIRQCILGFPQAVMKATTPHCLSQTKGLLTSLRSHS